MQNFDFIQKVKEIEQNANNKILTDHFNTWKCNENYNNECPDIYAGEVDNGKVIKKWFSKENREIQIQQGNSTQCYDFSKLKPDTNKESIVIILESPHHDEYELNSSWNQPNPALGTTGTNLEKYIDCLIDAVSQLDPKIMKGKYQIVLMNSIQYQCSLGRINGRLNDEIRNLIFTSIWSKQEIKDDFSERLKSYKPSIIFNCCTSGNKGLRQLIQQEIEKNFKNSNTTLFEGTHPSSWYYENNITVEEHRYFGKSGQSSSWRAF